MEHGILSLAPAALAIVLAIATRNVVVSLFSAVALAGMVHTGEVMAGLLRSVDHTIIKAIADTDHAKTVLFTLLIGAMVGVIGKAGATRSLVEALAKRARSARSAQVIAWLSGLFVFFDDYANCMIVGSSMGPLFDRHKISRAKLAYIVDSTAAPVASLALVSTWVGFEVEVIKEGLVLANVDAEPYSFFVRGWPYRFYPILAMIFVGMLVLSRRDFGPMLAHERSRRKRAKPRQDPTQEAEGTAPWWVAVTPIVALIGVTLFELWRSGSPHVEPGAPLFRVLEKSDGYGSIMHGSLCALMVAGVLVLATRALPLKKLTEAALAGMRLMFEALVVLILAWALSGAMKDLHAPQYLVSVLRNVVAPGLLPTIVFLVGAAISFAVGSSYTTMGIMMPMVIPLAFELAPGAAADPAGAMLPLAASGSVLAGACFGDHCSPISDTTVLSSIGSGADHLVHVRTQLPYALLVGSVAIVFGTLPAGYGLNPWLSVLIGVVACAAALRAFGRVSSSA